MSQTVLNALESALDSHAFLAKTAVHRRLRKLVNEQGENLAAIELSNTRNAEPEVVKALKDCFAMTDGIEWTDANAHHPIRVMLADIVESLGYQDMRAMHVRSDNEIGNAIVLNETDKLLVQAHLRTAVAEKLGHASTSDLHSAVECVIDATQLASVAQTTATVKTTAPFVAERLTQTVAQKQAQPLRNLEPALRAHTPAVAQDTQAERLAPPSQVVNSIAHAGFVAEVADYAAHISEELSPEEYVRRRESGKLGEASQDSQAIESMKDDIIQLLDNQRKNHHDPAMGDLASARKIAIAFREYLMQMLYIEHCNNYRGPATYSAELRARRIAAIDKFLETAGPEGQFLIHDTHNRVGNFSASMIRVINRTVACWQGLEQEANDFFKGYRNIDTAHADRLRRYPAVVLASEPMQQMLGSLHTLKAPYYAALARSKQPSENEQLNMQRAMLIEEFVNLVLSCDSVEELSAKLNDPSHEQLKAIGSGLKQTSLTDSTSPKSPTRSGKQADAFTQFLDVKAYVTALMNKDLLFDRKNQTQFTWSRAHLEKRLADVPEALRDHIPGYRDIERFVQDHQEAVYHKADIMDKLTPKPGTFMALIHLLWTVQRDRVVSLLDGDDSPTAKFYHSLNRLVADKMTIPHVHEEVVYKPIYDSACKLVSLAGIHDVQTRSSQHQYDSAHACANTLAEFQGSLQDNPLTNRSSQQNTWVTHNKKVSILLCLEKAVRDVGNFYLTAQNRALLKEHEFLKEMFLNLRVRQAIHHTMNCLAALKAKCFTEPEAYEHVLPLTLRLENTLENILHANTLSEALEAFDQCLVGTTNTQADRILAQANLGDVNSTLHDLEDAIRGLQPGLGKRP